MNDVKLGTLLTPEAKRDAIHVAVAPVVAGENLRPGEHVGVSPDGVASGSRPFVGIVDPFLSVHVKPGERFYLFLYQNTVTSLRHEWTHPAFGGAPPFKSANEASDAYAESERWLRAYAEKKNEYTVGKSGKEAAYQELLEGLRTRSLHFNGNDLYGYYDLEGDADDLRFHGERVLGIRIDFDNFTYSCSC